MHESCGTHRASMPKTTIPRSTTAFPYIHISATRLSQVSQSGLLGLGMQLEVSMKTKRWFIASLLIVCTAVPSVAVQIIDSHVNGLGQIEITIDVSWFVDRY